MDATPDLKRLAPVENLAIDVISYAHGSVTPTLTHLYSKGKDSFLKVRRRQRRDTKKCTGVPFSFLSFSLSLSLVFVEHTKDTRDACAWIYVRSVGSIVLNATIFARVSTVSLKAFRGAWNFDWFLFFWVSATNDRHTFFSSSFLKRTKRRRQNRQNRQNRTRASFFCGVAGWCVGVSISRRTNETISHSWTNKRRGLSTPSKGWLLRTARQ